MPAARFYSSVAVSTTLSGTITGGATSMTVGSTTGFPVSFPYTLILERNTGNEEAVEVTAAAGPVLTVTRGVDSTPAVGHNAGATVEHGVTARDHREPMEHIGASADVHGLTGGNAVVGTGQTQTLSNKTIPNPSITGTVGGSATYTTPTLTTPVIADFTSAQHDHGDADDAGGLVTGITLSSPTIANFTNATHGHTAASSGGTLPSGITLTAPTIADFTNAAHDHGDADDGGSLVASITLTTPTIASFTNATHTHANAAGGGADLDPATIDATGQITHQTGFIVPRTQLIIKTANQTYTSDATLNDDTELTLPVVANTRYAFTGWFNYFGPAAADFQWVFTAPTGATAHGVVVSSEEADAVNARDLLNGATVGTSGGTGTSSDGMWISGHVITAGTAGNFLFRHAQGVSNAGTTGVREGSWMQLIRN